MRNQSTSVMLNAVAVFFLTLSLTVLASAQGTPTQPQVLHNPNVHSAVQFDVSPPLSEMATEVVPESLEIEAPVRHPKLDILMGIAQRGLRPTPDGALQTTAGPAVSTNIGLNLLGVGNGFPGYSVPMPLQT